MVAVAEVDPTVAAALSTLASAIATALLMFAAYHWPAGRNDADDHRRRHHKDEDEED